MNNSTSSTGQPGGPSELWWQSVTLAELEEATAVIDEFTRESSTPPPAVSPERFARAIVLRMLCIDAGVVDALIAHADEKSFALVNRLQLDADSQNSGIDAYESWLMRRHDMGTGLKTCVTLLASPLRQAIDAKVEGFIRTTMEHQSLFFSILFGRGLQKPVAAPLRASFRSPAARAPGNGTSVGGKPALREGLGRLPSHAVKPPLS